MSKRRQQMRVVAITSASPVVVPYTNTKPSTPKTNFANSKCYAESLDDCVRTITREHWISESVLRELGKVLTVTAPKLGLEEKELRPANLAAKVLCERHNEALSGLDDHAKHLFRCLMNAEERLLAGGGEDHFNGFDIERWLLKALCGSLAAEGQAVPRLWVRMLFRENDIVAPSGLNMNFRLGEKIARPSKITVEPGRDAKGELVGCGITMIGLRFLLSLSGKRLFGADDLGKRSLFRPSHITFVHAQTSAEYTMWFTWEPHLRVEGIRLNWAPGQ